MTPPLPSPLTAEWIGANHPGLQVERIASHELQVTRPGHPTVLRLKLKHEGFDPEGSATWPGVLQRFTRGVASETSRWDEASEWPVSWDLWVRDWLAALSATPPRSVRPDKGAR